LRGPGEGIDRPQPPEILVLKGKKIPVTDIVANIYILRLDAPKFRLL